MEKFGPKAPGYPMLNASIEYSAKLRAIKDHYDKHEKSIYSEYQDTLQSFLKDHKQSTLIFSNKLENIKQKALIKYQNTEKSARHEYLRVKRMAKGLAFNEYIKLIHPALSRYNKIRKNALYAYQRRINRAFEGFYRQTSRFLLTHIKPVQEVQSKYNIKTQHLRDEYERTRKDPWLEFCKNHHGKTKKYYEKWLSIALRTTPINHKRAISLIKALYKKLGLKKPKIDIFDSPLKCLSNIPRDKLSEETIPTNPQIILQNNLDITGAELSVDPKIRGYIKEWLFDRIRTQIYQHSGNHLDQLKIESPIWCFGNHNAYRGAYYEFYRDVLGFKAKDEVLFEIFIALTQELHWFLPYKDLCLVSDFPAEIRRYEQGNTRPYMWYKDGFSVWELNGIRVSRQIAETPADKLDVRLLVMEDNTNVRAEIVKKIGIERVCRDLGAKCIDKQGNYELLIIDVEGWRKLPYLKMTNPSIGIYHIEGVHPRIRTVRDALKWRNQSEEEPQQLT